MKRIIKYIATFIVITIFVIIEASCNTTGATLVTPTSAVSEITTSSSYIRKEDNNRGVIVFVHGFTGDSIKSWTNFDTGAYWPRLLNQDPIFNGFDIYVYEYPTSLFNESFSIDEIAERMRLFLDADQVSAHQELIFLVHSMGGVITRTYLNKYSNVAKKVRLIYFFSTPTTGSQVANLANVFVDNPQITQLTKMTSDSYLADVQRAWLAHGYGINSYCAYEKQKTNGVLVVGQESATNLCNKRVDPIDANHIDMAKPRDLRDERYLAFKSAFLDTHNLSVNADESTSTSVPSALGRMSNVEPKNIRKVAELRIRDLLQRTQNVHSLLREIRNGQITQAGSINSVNDLNEELVALWLKIAGYGLGTDPFLDKIQVAISDYFGEAKPPPDYGIAGLYTSVGIPRLYEQFLDVSDISNQDAQEKKEKFGTLVQPYSNPAVYPHREFYERAYNDYRMGRALSSTLFTADLQNLDLWLSGLENVLSQIPGYFSQ